MKLFAYKGFLLCLVIAIIVSGCASTESGQSENKTGQPTITLTLWAGQQLKNVDGYNSPNFGDYEKAVAEEFQKKYPNVKIEIVPVPFKDIEQKTSVAISSNNMPDIIYDNIPIRIMKWARKGVFEPLDDVVNADKSDWKESFLSMGTIDNKLYALPVSMLPGMAFINRDLFDKKGLGHLIPKDRVWTWTQLREAVKQVSDKNVYGTAFFAKNEQMDQVNYGNLMGKGAKWINPEHTKFLINSQEGVDSLTFMIDMIDEGLAAPGAANLAHADTQQLFVQGKLAVLHDLPMSYNMFESGKKDGSVVPSVNAYGILPVFHDGVKPKLLTAGENGYALFKQQDPEKKKMAIEFMKLLTAPEKLQAVNKTILGIPPRKSVNYTVDNQDYNELLPKLMELEIVDQGKSDIGAFSEIRQKLYPALQAAILKNKTPQQALDEFVSQANEIAAKK